MKTPNLWQKLTTGFKNPFQKFIGKTDTRPEQTENFIPEFAGGGSIYYSKRRAIKTRKHKKRLENRARAINYNKR